MKSKCVWKDISILLGCYKFFLIIYQTEVHIIGKESLKDTQG